MLYWDAFTYNLSLEDKKFVSDEIPDEDNDSCYCLCDDSPFGGIDGSEASHGIEYGCDSGIHDETNDGNGDKLKKLFSKAFFIETFFFKWPEFIPNVAIDDGDGHRNYIEKYKGDSLGNAGFPYKKTQNTSIDDEIGRANEPKFCKLKKSTVCGDFCEKIPNWDTNDAQYGNAKSEYYPRNRKRLTEVIEDKWGKNPDKNTIYWGKKKISAIENVWRIWL